MLVIVELVYRARSYRLHKDIGRSNELDRNLLSDVFKLGKYKLRQQKIIGAIVRNRISE